jgi:hypothetical protein
MKKCSLKMITICSTDRVYRVELKNKTTNSNSLKERAFELKAHLFLCFKLNLSN